MGNKSINGFEPEVAIHPGESIEESMEFLGMSQEELATRLDITTKHLSNILNGHVSVTPNVAVRLEAVLGPSAQFWMNLESNYQLNRIRLEQRKGMEEEVEVMKEIPYRHMAENGWILKDSDKARQIEKCRSFYGVANLTSISDSYAVAYRKQKSSTPIHGLPVIAWLRQAEMESLKVQVEKFDRKRLKSLIPTFRELTLLPPETFYPRMRILCASCGVALVLVKCLPKTSIAGATLWRDNKAILALSVRGKKADIFWFTFFHEIAHILQQPRKELHIHSEGELDEAESDERASEYLITSKQYEEFLASYAADDRTAVLAYSRGIGIAPSILIGRLKRDKKIPYTLFHDLQPSFEM